VYPGNPKVDSIRFYFGKEPHGVGRPAQEEIKLERTDCAYFQLCPNDVNGNAMCGPAPRITKPGRTCKFDFPVKAPSPTDHANHPH
jgi:hypothetical protein